MTVMFQIVFILPVWLALGVPCHSLSPQTFFFVINLFWHFFACISVLTCLSLWLFWKEHEKLTKKTCMGGATMILLITVKKYLKQKLPAQVLGLNLQVELYHA